MFCPSTLSKTQKQNFRLEELISPELVNLLNQKPQQEIETKRLELLEEIVRCLKEGTSPNEIYFDLAHKCKTDNEVESLGNVIAESYLFIKRRVLG